MALFPAIKTAAAGIRVQRPKIPVPPTDFQMAQQQVHAAYQPVIDQTTSSYNDRAANLQNAYNNETAMLAKLMGSYAPTAAAGYADAKASQGAVDAALAAALGGQGSSAASDLSGRLAAIDADPGTAARINAGEATANQGGLGAFQGRQSAALSQLIAEGAHAQDYGAKQPGIAGLYGLQASNNMQAQTTNELKAALGDLTSKEPAAVQTALANIQTNRARQQQLAFEQSYKNAVLGNTQAKTNASVTQGWARTGIAQQNANTAASRAQNVASASATSAAERARHDRATEANAGKMTADQAAGVRTKAVKDLEDFYHGVPAKTRANGSVATPQQNPLTYAQAIQELGRRYPGLGRKTIMGLVTSLYQPGEGGRPLPKPPAGARIVTTAQRMAGTTAPPGGPPAAVDLSRGVTYYWQNGQWVAKRTG